jgi:hypothetical protein
MSIRDVGSYIGHNRVTSTSQDSASGIWSLRAVERQMRAAAWPQTFPFAPDDLSGLQLWLDASDSSTLYDATSGGSLVAADGGVARWQDKSGNARHATQSTSANRPARKTAIQGGKDVLRFDGSNDSLSIASSTETFKFVHSSDSTVFVVFKSGTTANPGHNAYIVLGTANSTTTVVGALLYTGDSDPTSANNTLYWYVSRGGAGTYPVFFDGNNYFPSNAFGMISLLSKPQDGTSGSRFAIRRNGGSLNSTNSPGGSPQTVSTASSTDDLTVGRAPSGESDFLNGDIAEIIIYDSALSDTDREAVENYLLAKWAIT